MNIEKYITEAVKLMAMPLSMRLKRPIMPPSVAAVYLTKKCNSRCTMCSFWEQKFDPEEELSLEDIKRLFSDLRKLGVKFLSLGAEGELFTRKDIIDIFAAAKNEGLRYTINTNGLYQPKAFLERLSELSPYSIVFGLDTMDSETYVKIRGIDNGPQKVLKSISKLKKNGFNNISIGAVVLDHNLDQLIPLADMVRDTGAASLRVTAFSPVGFGMDWDKKDLEKYWHPDFLDNLKKVISKLIDHKKKYGILSNTVEYLNRIPEYYSARFKYLPQPCVIGYYNVQILPDGNVPVCGFRGQKAIIGNIKNESIIDLWKKKETQDQRNAISQGKCPTCWLSCYAENNLRFYPKTMIQCNFAALHRAVDYGI